MQVNVIYEMLDFFFLSQWLFYRETFKSQCSVSIIKLKRQFFRTDPRIEPKFGTQVRIDTITLIG